MVTAGGMPPSLFRANVLTTEKFGGSLYYKVQNEAVLSFVKCETGLYIISYMFGEKSCPWRPLVLEVVVSRQKGPG